MSHLSVQTKLETVSANLHHYVHKQVQPLSLLSMNKRIVFLWFLNKGSTVIFLYIFIGSTYIIKSSIYLCSKFTSLSFWAIFCFPNPDYLSPPPSYSGLTMVYCILFTASVMTFYQLDTRRILFSLFPRAYGSGRSSTLLLALASAVVLRSESPAGLVSIFLTVKTLCFARLYNFIYMSSGKFTFTNKYGIRHC
jgi:hypothetical protein